MEQFILPFLFLPLLVSLRSKQMREKPHKTGCLSLHDCRCPNPKKHKLHNQIFIKKKQVTGTYDACKISRTRVRLPQQSEEYVWVHTRRRKSLRLHLHEERSPSTAITLEDGRMRHMRMCNLFVHSDFCCCFNTTPTDRDSATENN